MLILTIIIGFEDERGMIHSITHNFERFGIKEGGVAFQTTYLTQSMTAMLTHPHGKPAGVAVKDCTHILSELRIVNEDEEIECIRRASKVAEKGMEAAIKAVKPVVTESKIEAEAEHAMRQAGGEEFWRTYVSSGPRTNIAHGFPTSRKIKRNDLVMIDIHPVVDGYSADICRTVCVDKPTADQQAAHDLYLKVQQTTSARSGQGWEGLN